MNRHPSVLKWLVAFCMLDGVAASEFDAISNPDLNPSPAPELTCGCAVEIHLTRTQLRKEFEAKVEAELQRANLTFDGGRRTSEFDAMIASQSPTPELTCGCAHLLTPAQGPDPRSSGVGPVYI